MLKNIILTISLFALIFTSYASFRAAIPDSELAAASNGIIPLTFVGGQYTAPVAFAQGSTSPTNMVIALYTSDTVITETCLNFNKFSPRQFPCKVSNNGFQSNYAQFSAEGKIATAQVYLDYKNWALVNTEVKLAQNCMSQVINQNSGTFGSGSFGLLGLGYQGGAKSHFLNGASKFAVYYSSSQRTMALEFNPTAPKNKIAQVRTDENWHVKNVVQLQIDASSKNVANVAVMFDLNSQAIGVPLEHYGDIITALKGYGVSCPQNAYLEPVCNYNGNYLPTITIVDSNGNKIPLYANVYAQVARGTVKLNLKATSPKFSGLNYVTFDYQNYIILGSSFMGNYYNLFNRGDSSVTILANPNL